MSPDKSFIKYAIPLLQALRDQGGQLRLAESIEATRDRLGLTDWQLDQPGLGTEPSIRTGLTWARAHLISWGYLNLVQPDQIRLTASGLAASDSGAFPDATEALFNDSQRRFIAGLQVADTSDASSPVAAINPSAPPAPEPSRASASEAGSDGLPTSRDLGTVPGNELIPILDSLNPTIFGRLLEKLLSRQRFTEVRITERLEDGSISGIGTLAINPLVGIKGMLHIKKTQVPISRALIREFRGTLVGRASKGIFVTTGRFTPEAREEADRDGVDPIDLVDGIQLIRMLEELEIAVKARTVYDLDPLFFEG
jgi:restriction system protein